MSAYKPRRKSRRSSGRMAVIVVSCLLLLGIVIGGTVSWLIDKTEPLDNRLNPTQVSTQVQETWDGTTKSNVSIKNTGGTDAWIRASVVITWKNDKGDVYGKPPVEGTDYTIDKGYEGWLLGGDGFDYYEVPVAPGEATTNLINSCTSKGTEPEGYYLTVEIIGSGIQSAPITVFGENWNPPSVGITSDGSHLEKVN